MGHERNPYLALAVSSRMTTLAPARTDWTPERIRALRKRLRWNQTELATALGYERQASVSDLETGKMEPSGAVAVLLDLIDAHDGLPRRG